jgi:E3 ubiquitin-protein ligase DOA10
MIPKLETFSRRVVHGLTVMFWAVLALMGGLRVWQSLALKTWLVQSGVQPGPFYLTWTGAAQTVAALFTLSAFFSRGRLSGWIVRLLTLLWMLAFWIDRIWIAVSPAARVNDAFAAVFLAFWLIVIWTATSQQK